MPAQAKFKLISQLSLVAVAYALLVYGAIHLALPTAWLVILLILLLTITLLALDAFYPKVNLFAPAIVNLPANAQSKDVALTFDDGPVYPYTEQILDVLHRYDVKASFFCIGENVARQPDLARAIVTAGHTLGNHTQNHRNLMFANRYDIAQRLDQGQDTIRGVTGQTPRFFRCPKGYKSPLVTLALRRRKLKLVGYGYPIWDIQNPPPEQLVSRVLDRVRPGDIIVMHDGFPAGHDGKRDSLVQALPRIIEGLLERELRPVSLDQVLV